MQETVFFCQSINQLSFKSFIESYTQKPSRTWYSFFHLKIGKNERESLKKSKYFGFYKKFSFVVESFFWEGWWKHYFRSDKLTVGQRHAEIECMDLDRWESHTFAVVTVVRLGCFESYKHLLDEYLSFVHSAVAVFVGNLLISLKIDIGINI